MREEGGQADRLHRRQFGVEVERGDLARLLESAGLHHRQEAAVDAVIEIGARRGDDDALGVLRRDQRGAGGFVLPFRQGAARWRR